MVLEAEYSFDVKEQALCILTNIADGDTAKDLIMTNEDVLKKLMNYMVRRLLYMPCSWLAPSLTSSLLANIE